MIGSSLLLAVALASPVDADLADASAATTASEDDADASEAGASAATTASEDEVAASEAGASAEAPLATQESSAASVPATERRARTGRGMLIAGGVLTGLGVVGRIALEVYWSTAAQIVPTDPFARWSAPNVVFVTNWNNLMFFGPGLGLLTAGAYRRGGHEAGLGRVRDARRMRLVGIGLLGGGLGLWALSRALFLPIAEACPSNRCAYTTLETSFWISAGAIFAGAAHLAYGTGYSRAAARVRVAPSFGPGFAGFGLAGRF